MLYPPFSQEQEWIGTIMKKCERMGFAIALPTLQSILRSLLIQVKRINDSEFIFNHLIMLHILRIKEWETIKQCSCNPLTAVAVNDAIGPWVKNREIPFEFVEKKAA